MNPLQKDVFYQASFDRNWNPVCVCVCVRVCGEGKRGWKGEKGKGVCLTLGTLGTHHLDALITSQGVERQQKIIVNVTYDTSSRGFKQLSRYG